MKKSIIAKLFLLTSILLSVFLLFTLLFQLTVFEKFYMAARVKDIDESMKQFIKQYQEQRDDKSSVSALIDKFELKNDIAIILFDKEMVPVSFSKSENSFSFDKEKLINMLKNNIVIEKKPNERANNEEFSISMSMTPHEKGSTENFVTYYINTYSINNINTAYIFYTHKVMNEAKSAIYELYKYFIAVSVIIILILSVLYARLIARPLVKLNKAASKMSELDFSQKCETKSEDEIGKLGQTLNYLSQNLNQTLSELNQANNKLQDDINKEKKLAKMRKDFIATVSHELKTPLSLIKGYAQAFKDNIVREDSKGFYSEVILDEAEKMSEMVSKMLDLTELESDYVVVNKDKFCISTLAAYMQKKFSPMALAKGISLVNELSGTQIVCADRTRIEQAFENLITNAIKHTPDNGTISIRAENLENALLVNIENMGIHIPEAEIENVWDMFYKGKNQESKKKDSTGLGLAIVKKILELHKGSYGVYNTKNGVCFFFTLEYGSILLE